MKKLFFLAATVLSVALIASCEDDSPGFSVSPDTLNFTAAGGTDNVYLLNVTNPDWYTVTSNNPGWIHPQKQGFLIVVSVDSTTEARTGSITVASVNDSKVIKIIQTGSPSATILYELDNSSYGALETHFNANLTTLDADYDEQIWHPANLADKGMGIQSLSLHYYTGAALTPDNWLLLPGRQVVSDGRFTMTIKATDYAAYEEHFEVRIAESPISLGDMSTAELLFEHRFDDYKPYYVDVAIPDSYNGKTVYIAIRHVDLTDEFKKSSILIQAMKLTHNPD